MCRMSLDLYIMWLVSLNLFHMHIHLISKIDGPRQTLKSALNFVNAAISGLSLTSFPLFPRAPHLHPPPSSSSGTTAGATTRLVFVSKGSCWLGPPPRMADTLDCAHHGCFRMAEVTVMHSVMTRATGSTAMAMGAWRVRVVGGWCRGSGGGAGEAVWRIAMVQCGR